MTRTDESLVLTQLLTATGLTVLASNMRLFTDAEADQNGDIRATLEIGYVGDKGRFKLTAVSNYPGIDNVVEAFSQRKDIASMIDMGINAIPAEKRPDLPQWVREESEAKRIRADMARARGLAVAAV
jgi:hypothetical protein